VRIGDVMVAMSSMSTYMSGGTLMNNPHDDDLAARLEEIRARPHWTWTDYDRDDLGSDAMSRGFEGLRQLQEQGLLPPPPPRKRRNVIRLPINPNN
jgi:hypothetical protein